MRATKFNAGDKVVIAKDIDGTKDVVFLENLRNNNKVLSVVMVDNRDPRLTVYTCVDHSTGLVVSKSLGTPFGFLDADLEEYKASEDNAILMIYKNIYVTSELIKEHKLTDDQVIGINKRVVELLSYIVDGKPLPATIREVSIVETLASIIFDGLFHNSNIDIVKYKDGATIPLRKINLCTPSNGKDFVPSVNDVFTSILGLIAASTMDDKEHNEEEAQEDDSKCNCILCTLMSDIKEIKDAKVEDADAPTEENLVDASESFEEMLNKVFTPDVEAKRLSMIYDKHSVEMPSNTKHIGEVTVTDGKGVEVCISVLSTNNVLDSMSLFTVDNTNVMTTPLGKEIRNNALLGRMIMGKLLNNKEVKYNDDHLYTLPELDIDTLTVEGAKFSLEDKHIFVVRNYFDPKF